ncbi:MAG: hypothetical protein QG657_2986, partial [Acidobacteriota bacterium]|nr:hypothetical protein [Acidobacteriota bacterium]
YGSRCPHMKGKDRYDITDDELHQWLQPILEKTDNVVIISDSCYSASVTRGNILSARSVSPDQRHYPSLSKIALRKEAAGGILIGAAQDDELAFEATFNGETHGLFSWYWIDALKQSYPGDTWSDLFQRTYIMVSNYFDQQHPQFQGDADKPVFGNVGKKNRPRVPISRIWNNGKAVRIEAGSLSGVSNGSIYRLYNPLETDINRLPRLEITKITPFYSEAISEEAWEFKIGDLVIEENNILPMELIAVFFAVEIPFCGIQRELRLLMPHVEKTIHANRLQRLTPPHSFDVNLSISLWQPVEKKVQANVDGIEASGIYLELPDSQEFFKKCGVFSPIEIEEKQVFPAGSLLTFQVKNNSGRDCYIYLLDIMENGGAEAIFPSPGDRRQRALLPAGCELDLKNIVLLLLDRPGREIIRLIATEAPIDLALLTQETFMMAGRGNRKHWGTIQFSITIDGTQ